MVNQMDFMAQLILAVLCHQSRVANHGITGTTSDEGWALS